MTNLEEFKELFDKVGITYKVEDSDPAGVHYLQIEEKGGYAGEIITVSFEFRKGKFTDIYIDVNNN